MARVVLPEAKLFKEVIETIGNVAEEVALVFSQDGLTVRALDVDQSSLVDVLMPRDMFSDYDIAETLSIGVSINSLKKVLRHLKKGENLAIEPEGDFIKFVVGSSGVVSRIFKFRNLDVAVPEVPELELNFTVTAKILAQSLKKVIEDIETIGGSTQIKATQEEIVFKSTGTGKLEVKFTIGSMALISLEVSEPAEAVYDTAKLINILNVARVSDVVTLRFATKMPIKAEFSIGPGRVVYLLAPFEVS
ncbi:MAG: DNA polymerase sliding clamp [Desulfurococcaceae archaeon]